MSDCWAIKDLHDVRIATSFPNITLKYLQGHGIEAHLVTLTEGAEIFPLSVRISGDMALVHGTLKITLRRRVLRDVVIDGVVARRQHRQKESDRYRDQSRHEGGGKLDACRQHPV